ncbi:GSCFA domain-containing protein [Pararobbsia silviterrae]|uniref:GSCFA domain-containing protein n=1 Tax=Pararobbsia silviterrae TaxID=1792498 RepID=A0A494YEG1_9BURK|nr:GSCFA domain-containing protein [Pararobbsia silviterrae]RKP58467.1 hypothetical protein D7S86_00425 [Pararobbsia silviterrae]
MHPYKHLPAENFWKRSVSDHVWSSLNFKPNTRFKIQANDKVSTAGSCFAQHIARNLPSLGLHHFVSETPHPMMTKARADESQYGVFSARYGNIYTARQLRQLIEFAFDIRERTVLVAQCKDGWADMLRPSIPANHFASPEDVAADRHFHLDCVRRMFIESDYFVFTLGLTEAWFDTETGIVFPACPGTRVGEYDATRHQFVNYSFGEILDDLKWCIAFCRSVNPGLRWLFTVSPVALAATATEHHVVVATAASKAILRAVADEICRSEAHCDYFPSFEIISSPASFGQFLDGDLRSISPRGVSLVMDVFRRSFVQTTVTHRQMGRPISIPDEHQTAAAAVREAVRAECDEAYNDPDAVG